MSMSNLDGFVGKGEEKGSANANANAKVEVEDIMKKYDIKEEEMEERPMVILREGEEITGSVIRMREVKVKFGDRIALDLDTADGPRTLLVVHKVLAKKLLQLKLKGRLEGHIIHIKNAGKAGKAYGYEVDVLDQPAEKEQKAEADEFIRRDF